MCVFVLTSKVMYISDDSKAKVSNELEIVLPLETEHIRLPPRDARMDDDDLYKEYVEVRVDVDHEVKKG